jgi:hypothetical protein
MTFLRLKLIFEVIGTIQNGGRCGYGAPTAKSPGSGVKLTFRLNVVDPSWLTEERYVFSQGRRRGNE